MRKGSLALSTGIFLVISALITGLLFPHEVVNFMWEEYRLICTPFQGMLITWGIGMFNGIAVFMILIPMIFRRWPVLWLAEKFDSMFDLS